MVRIVVIILGLFVVWVLFGSKFSKQRKIVLSVAAILLAALGVWYESHGETPRSGLIKVAELQECGATAEHSYRSNYDVNFCLQNNSKKAAVKRLRLRFIAERCAEGKCKQMDAVEKEFAAVIAPGETLQRTENMPFDKLTRGAVDFNWRVEPIEVKATR